MAEISLSVIYITANVIPKPFMYAVQGFIEKGLTDEPIISVSKKPIVFGHNICVGETPISQASIYRQVLVGAKAAETKYVAITEDDVLYSPAHFQYRPPEGTFGYNMSAWNIYTWGEPMFSYKAPGGRKNLNGLICERQLLIDYLEERFKLWPDDEKIDKSIYGEPGKYDRQLGTTPRPVEHFYVNPPNIVFSHQTALGYKELGQRKAVGQIRATEIPFWGRAEDIRRLYDGV